MDLKDLDKFLKVCRKRGVTEISYEGVSVTFGDLPPEVGQSQEVLEVGAPELSMEELAFYHTQEV